MCGVVSGCGAELTIAATPQSMAEPGTSIVLVKRRAVTQMVAISDLNRLLVLCDGLITVHDLETLEKQHSAILEKGVSMFCMDQQGAPLHRMCAVRKKKVLIYEFSLGRFAYMKVGTASWSRRGRAELACKVVTHAPRRCWVSPTSPCLWHGMATICSWATGGSTISSTATAPWKRFGCRSTPAPHR